MQHKAKQHNSVSIGIIALALISTSPSQTPRSSTRPRRPTRLFPGIMEVMLTFSVYISFLANGTGWMRMLVSLGSLRVIVSTSSNAIETEISTVNPTNWLRECVPPYKAKGPVPQWTFLTIDWSNYYQIAKPSGLCADALSCAFERCMWIVGLPP